jgi:hypothetical protein
MKYLHLIALLFTFNTANAQHQEVAEKPALWKGKPKQTTDTSSLLYIFTNGQMHGHFRYFFMATNNKPGLTDYFANAAGGGIKYETGSLKGFQLGISGFFIFNIGSSDFTVPDPKTGQMNRYEIGLFDVQKPSNKTDINRLEELYLKYSWKKSNVVIGKQLINTAFINLQDGRMRPTEVGGVYATFNEVKNTQIEAGYLKEISPRSTVAWYGVGASVGVYGTGVNPDGTKSGYAGNLNSKGIALFGVSTKLQQQLSLKLYNVFVQNIFNSVLLQADGNYAIPGNSKIVAAIQYIRQDAVNNGGNADIAKTYFTKGGKAQTFGIKAGWENRRWQTSVNYNRITKDGRYLVPREWGREPFFTFLPRERNEGLADVHAYVVKVGYTFTRRVKVQAAWGYFDLPSVNNYAFNKYGLPAYTQCNLDIRHEFKGFLKGLEAQLLFVYKAGSGNTYGNDKYVINKVDMASWNLLFNYHF